MAVLRPLAAIAAVSDVQCVAATENMRWLFAGGSEGVITKFDFYSTINGGKMHLARSKQCSFCAFDGVMLSSWQTIDHSSSTTAVTTTITNTSNAQGEKRRQAGKGIHSLYAQKEGVWCLSGSADGHLDLWSCRVDEGARVYRKQIHDGPVSGMQLPASEDVAFSIGFDGNIGCTDLNSGASSTTRTEHKGVLSTMHLAATGGDTGLTVIGGLDGSASIWNCSRSQQTKTLQLCNKASSDLVVDVKWSSVDKNLVYIARRGGSCDEWDIRNVENPVRVLHAGATVSPRSLHSICTVKDRIILAFSDEICAVTIGDNWRHPHWLYLSGHQGGSISQLCASTDGQFLVAAAGTRGLGGTCVMPQTLVYDISLLSDVTST